MGAAESTSTGISSPTSKGVTLAAGNYEWPFELMLPGNTAESVEGLNWASITYQFKATLVRGKLAHDIHTMKQLRIIRTLEPSALEFTYGMSVENLWPNKLEYSIVVPTKAVVFGGAIPLETRFTPLKKGLELEDITVKLWEIHELVINSSNSGKVREHRNEREVEKWVISVSRAEHWQNMIEDTGQEGWIVKKDLPLPTTLGKCQQDVNVHGIKIRHKLKLVVCIRNPDGHASELRASLPVSIFISPNMQMDEAGNLVQQTPQGATAEQVNAIAPPGYGQHILDQLYQDVDFTGYHTPVVTSGISTPLYSHSRAGSSDNLAAMAMSNAVAPSALASRLHNMSLESNNRDLAPSPGAGSEESPSVPLSRQNSDGNNSGPEAPEHIDFPDLSELSKVPSYNTAVKAPVRSQHPVEGLVLPNYQMVIRPELPLMTIAEAPREGERESENSGAQSPPRRRTTLTRRHQLSLGTHFSQALRHHADSDEVRRVLMLQARGREG